MNPYRTIFIGLSLTAATVLLAPTAQAQQDTVIKLNYGNGAACNFNTAGIQISGASANVIHAAGQFDASSNCPTGGSGGNTGVANLSLNATPDNINDGETTDIVWNATADVCRYDGSVLPGVASGWQTSGYACVGAAACAAGNNINPMLNASGIYSFKLTCLSGASSGQPQTQITKTAQVEVIGNNPPPTGSCSAAPAGLTRVLVGTIKNSAGTKFKTNVDVTEWQNVFGYNLQDGSVLPWPGLSGNDIKMAMGNHQYWSLKFTVGNNYPFSSSGGWPPPPADPGYGPFGGFATNQTNTTPDVAWTMSITSDCGDFTQPTSGPDRVCYQEYRNSTGSKLIWEVKPSGEYADKCTLRRGQTYYLNILPAALGDPLNSLQEGCNQSSCLNNFQQTGNFSGSQGM